MPQHLQSMPWAPWDQLGLVDDSRHLSSFVKEGIIQMQRQLHGSIVDKVPLLTQKPRRICLGGWAESW